MQGIVHVVCGLLSASILSVAVSSSQQSVVDVHGTARAGERPARDTVVWLEAPNAPARPQTGRVVLDQRNLSFSPHVLVVRVGTTVDFPNNDRVFHNVFSFRDGKRFDLGMYPVGHDAPGDLRPAGPEPHLLQHPPEHGGVCHDRRLAVLRARR